MRKRECARSSVEFSFREDARRFPDPRPCTSCSIQCFSLAPGTRSRGGDSASFVGEFTFSTARQTSPGRNLSPQTLRGGVERAADLVKLKFIRWFAHSRNHSPGGTRQGTNEPDTCTTLREGYSTPRTYANGRPRAFIRRNRFYYLALWNWRISPLSRKLAD